MHTNCIKCLLGQANKLLNKYSIQDEVARDIIIKFRLYLIENNQITAPEASCSLHRMIKKATLEDDPYQKEKKYYNELLLNMEQEIREIINNSDDPFKTALKYALAGNIIDFGAPNSFDVHKALSEAKDKKPAIDHIEELRDALKKAKTVLYLGDNAGEIVMDKLFIETINHPNLYFSVRGSNIINDVTLEDARNTGMVNVAKVISNGYDAPSTLIDYCSPEFIEIYNQADIVISKGQGNLEGLLNITDKKIFFLFMVKCIAIAETVKVQEKNVVVLLNQKIERN